jgi:hypothetical protein
MKFTKPPTLCFDFRVSPLYTSHKRSGKDELALEALPAPESRHTAKFHVASIMGKLGAASRTEAVTLGIRHGLVMI